MTEQNTTVRERLQLGRNATAIAAAIIALPWYEHALHIAGDQYGGAWALIILAAWLDHRRSTLLRRALLWLTIIGAVVDLPVLQHSVTYLTGAAW